MAIVVNRSVTSSDEQTQKILNLFYPVGSYYETSDTTFNPNTSWGGTWVEDTAGRMTVAVDTGTFSTVGGTGGSETHTHLLQGTGALAKVILKGDSRILYKEVQVASGEQWTANYKIQGSSAGAVSEGNQGWGAELQGNSQSASSLSPYVVVKRWHRTA